MEDNIDSMSSLLAHISAKSEAPDTASAADAPDKVVDPVLEPESLEPEPEHEPGHEPESDDPDAADGPAEPADPAADTNAKPESRAQKRIRELIAKTKEAGAKASEYKAQLEAAQIRESQIVQTLSAADADIKAEDFDTMAEYVKALTTAGIKRGIDQANAEKAANESKNAAANYEKAVADGYMAQIAAAETEIPDIHDVVKHINSYASRMPAAVREALLTDDHAAYVSSEIARSKELLEALIDGSPVQAIKLIAKLSSVYDAKGVEALPGAKEVVPLGAPKGAPAKTPIPAIPKPRAQSKATYDNLSPDQYYRMVAQGKAKSPIDIAMGR